MIVTVYLDMYFITNFIMNMLLLLLTQKYWYNDRRAWKRICLSAAAGAVFACGALILSWPITGMGWLVQWILAGAIMVFLAFPEKTWRQYGAILTSFLMVSALLGGILSVIYNGFQGAGLLPVLVLFIGGATGFFLIGAAVTICRKRLLYRSRFCRVTLHYYGKEKNLIALRDTGNQLYEPYTHQPVHVLSYEACTGWCESIQAVIFIPYRSVGKEYGLLPGVQMDSMDVWDGMQGLVTYEKPWIAISREPVSPEKKYEMLLHGE